MFKTNKKNNHYQYTQLLISITNTLYFDDCQNTKSSFLFTAFTVVRFTTVKAAMVAERNDQMQHLILFSVFHVSQKKEHTIAGIHTIAVFTWNKKTGLSQFSAHVNCSHFQVVLDISSISRWNNHFQAVSGFLRLMIFVYWSQHLKWDRLLVAILVPADVVEMFLSLLMWAVQRPNHVPFLLSP